MTDTGSEGLTPHEGSQLVNLVHQDIASTVDGLMSRQTGLGESPKDLANALIIALIKEATYLRIFFCRRSKRDPTDCRWAMVAWKVWTDFHLRNTKRSPTTKDGMAEK